MINSHCVHVYLSVWLWITPPKKKKIDCSVCPSALTLSILTFCNCEKIMNKNEAWSGDVIQTLLVELFVLWYVGAPVGSVQEAALFLYMDVLSLQSQPAVWQPAVCGEHWSEPQQHLHTHSSHWAWLLPGVSHTGPWWDICLIKPSVNHLYVTGSCLKPNSGHVKPHADWFNRGRWDNAIITRRCLHLNPVIFCHVSNFYRSAPAVKVPASLSSCKMACRNNLR